MRYGVYGKQKLDKGQVLVLDGVAYMSRPYFKELKSYFIGKRYERRNMA